MISILAAVVCNATAQCVTLSTMFRGPPTPAACERALAQVLPEFLSTSPGYELESQKCEGEGEDA